MAKVEVIDTHDGSLDSSADSDFLGIVDDRSFDGADCRDSQSYLEGNEDEPASNSYMKDLCEDTGGHPTTGATGNIIPPAQAEFIVLPMDMFGAAPVQRKSNRKEHREIQSKVITTKKRDDKRRATHNEVERRRRDKINSWITKLALLIPNSGLPDTASKGGILAKACDHITDLTEKQKKFDKLEKDNERLLTEILRLNKELSEVRKENSILRNQHMDEKSNNLLQRAKSQKS